MTGKDSHDKDLLRVRFSIPVRKYSFPWSNFGLFLRKLFETFSYCLLCLGTLLLLVYDNIHISRHP